MRLSLLGTLTQAFVVSTLLATGSKLTVRDLISMQDSGFSEEISPRR
jgi:hypothetical protein